MPSPDALSSQVAENRAHWDEAVAVHLASEFYELTALRSGRGLLHPIEEEELGSVAGKRVLHLQCHFGRDTLVLAQRGAEVVGLDFSGPAILAARGLADEVGLAARSTFVQANVYDARESIQGSSVFDLVFVTWGALCWLPDIDEWARIVGHFLRKGGSLYLADAHPSAWVLDDIGRERGATLPTWFVSYFRREAVATDGPDYADPQATLQNKRTHTWMHPLGNIVSALLKAGLSLDWLHEHDRVPWRMFECLVRGNDGMYRWPDESWLPLTFSLRATRR